MEMSSISKVVKKCKQEVWQLTVKMGLPRQLTIVEPHNNIRKLCMYLLEIQSNDKQNSEIDCQVLV